MPNISSMWSDRVRTFALAMACLLIGLLHGGPAYAAITVTVDVDQNQSLSKTGSDVLTLALAASGLLVLGITFILLAQRKGRLSS